MNTTAKLFSAAALLSSGLAFSGSALAETEQANFDVKLVIEGTCTITASELDFGTNSGSISSNLDQESALTVTCTNGTTYNIALDNGNGSGANAATRKMTNTADNSTVDYSLYSDTSRSTVWSDSARVSGTGNGQAQSIPVYGRVNAGQNNVTVGNYTDNIVATIEF